MSNYKSVFRIFLLIILLLLSAICVFIFLVIGAHIFHFDSVMDLLAEKENATVLYFVIISCGISFYLSVVGVISLLVYLAKNNKYISRDLLLSRLNINEKDYEVIKKKFSIF